MGPEPVIRAWKPGVPGVREVLHASFPDHAYPLHTHDTWTLFIVDDGAIRYGVGGRQHGAEPSMVSVLPPHVAHDGRRGSDRGYRKRVLYLEADLLGEERIGAAVDQPWTLDAQLRGDVAVLHESLACIDRVVESECRLGSVVERLVAALGGPAPATLDGDPTELAERFRAYLDERVFDHVTVADAAAGIGASTTQLARAFRQVFGIAPHAYLTGRRLDAARDRILDGEPLAQVAADVGFADQAHLSRRFRSFLGVPPGRFARGSRTA